MAAKKVKFWHPTAGFVRAEVGTEPIVVGRSGDIKLAGDERLSRRHGKVWSDGRGVWYEDLGSVNGSYVHGARLTAPVRISHGTAVYLGETRLSLDESDLPPLAPPAIPGMELKSHGRSDSEGLREALAGQGTASAYVAAMYDIVERLLHSDRQHFIASALRQLRHAVPGAQHLALVSWPPDPDGRFSDLSTGHHVTVSTTLARYAVEQKRAMLLSGHEIPPDMEAGPSMLHLSSAVYVPLVTQHDEVIGLLCADSHSDTRPLTEADFQFICAGDRIKGIKIVNNLDEGPWWADDRKMRQILGNLLSNAIKYSPQGGEVRVWSEEAGDDIYVHVRDQGVGIAPHEQEKVYSQLAGKLKPHEIWTGQAQCA